MKKLKKTHAKVLNQTLCSDGTNSIIVVQNQNEFGTIPDGLNSTDMRSTEVVLTEGNIKEKKRRIKRDEGSADMVRSVQIEE